MHTSVNLVEPIIKNQKLSQHVENLLALVQHVIIRKNF